MPLLERKRDYARVIIILSGVLPLLLGILFTAIDARHTVKQQQIGAANALLSQAEKMSDSAWDMITWLRQYHYKSCSEIESVLQRAGTLNAYFRAIGKLEGERVTCSSAYGINPGTLSEMMLRAPPVTGKAWWSLSLAGTAGVPQRPAVIFVRQLADNEGFWAIIDGQYLMDFMSAIGEARGYRVSMRFNNGAPIFQGEQPAASSGLLTAPIYQAESSRYPVSVTIETPVSELMRAWRQVMFIFLPMTAILSVLLMVLTANWLQRRISWRDEIRRAIRSHQLSVHYQPVYHNNTQRCAGVEALLRWTRPNGDIISPDIFISAAETEGMIVPLTQHLLELIVDDVQQWNVAPGFHIGINLAAEHLQHPAFIDDMLDFADKVKHKQLQITLELTERSLIKDGEEVARKLDRLRAEGMKVAIDDFGTGHCSLSYLQTFALDYLKIDRGFINAIESLSGETPVLDAIINLSHKLQLEVLGEGVETSLQYLYLRQRGVTFIQGYYYACPMDNCTLIAWLAEYGQQPLRTEEADDAQLHPS
ncbi:EAL domain-containing protein [Pantoea sp. KPR_PJ]|uniref:EAL domain-containing protein n=1 Tax=Pantoea sp. KPR_PJ TaxID=2738375 RepID=UPI003528E840